MKLREIRGDEKLPLGIGCIDNLLGGGFDRGVINQIYGQGGTGKTNVAMQMAVSAAYSGEKTIYIDTEGFSENRFIQIGGSRPEVSSNVSLYRVSDFSDQEVAVIKAEKMIEKDQRFKVLILDSFTAMLRLERDEKSKNISMQRQLSIMQRLCNEFDLTVLIANQIYFDPDIQGITPYGGYFLDHYSKTILKLEKLQSGTRRMTIMKHRSIGEGNFADFSITDSGLSCTPI
jgi:DNA repair protein RadB